MPRTAKRPTATTDIGGSGQSASPVVPARVQPITVPTGQAYGEAKALADAQRQLPLPNNSEPGTPTGPVVPTSGVAPMAPGGAGVDPGAVSAAARADITPAVGLGEPPRPGEVGAPSLIGLPSAPPDNVAAFINRLAPISSDLQYLAAFVNSGRR